MPETKLELAIPVKSALKEKQKLKLFDDLISAFKKNNVFDAKVADFYYIEKRALAEPLNLILVILSGAADIATITMVIWTFLREYDSKKEIELEVGEVKLKVRGNMSDKEIVELVKEAGKIANKKKK